MLKSCRKYRGRGPPGPSEQWLVEVGVAGHGDDKRLRINEQEITPQAQETILQAALRAGIAMPHSCRVGGCGSCRCRLEQGRVRQLTETAYLLSEDEIKQGYILACQSQPLGAVSVSYRTDDNAPRFTPQTMTGKIMAVSKLTPDIAEVAVALPEDLPYRAGQFAELSLEGVAGARSYSFASAYAPGARSLRFIVRRVPGGAFSHALTDAQNIGKPIKVHGPLGDFWLRSSVDPLLLVAGGSGLSAILAMLEASLAAGEERPVTLIFGARTAKDLYALDRIDAIAKAWKGRFHFIPVLAEETEASAWQGERGLVTHKVRELTEPAAHAYLCGPPAMIDAVTQELVDLDVPSSRIYTDRFVSAADGPASAVRSARPLNYSGAWHYCKYFGMHLAALFCTAAMLLGGSAIVWGLGIFVLFYTLGDAVSGDDKSTPRYRYPGVLRLQLWMALPLLLLFMFVFIWNVAPTDVWGFGHLVQELSGYDALAAKADTSFLQRLAGVVFSSLMIALLGTITAHELTHRTWDPPSLIIGRWLLAFSFDTIFAIEHVYGHHRYVGSTIDPATAPRGRHVYAHIVISTIKGNISAWQIEALRLRKKKHPILSWHNAVLRGYAMSMVLLLVAWLLGGWSGLAYFTLAGILGKALLEIVNYMEHYGIVRDLATPVDPRHSWNTNKRLSSWSSFNLTRHSHHHAQGEVPFHSLRPYPRAPEMISGYLATIVLTMIPPLWHRLMLPRLIHWDEHFASPREQQLAKEANRKSGLKALMQRA